MPSPPKSRTLADVRAECIALGIQPGRSVAECERRIAEHKGAQPPRMGRFEAIKGAEPFHGGYVTETNAKGVRRIVGTFAEVKDTAASAEAKPPRMSKLARGLCTFTALCTTLRYLPAWVYRGGELAWCSTPQGWAWRMMPPNHLRGLSPDNFRAFGATDRRF